jgi:hypothetical protein
MLMTMGVWGDTQQRNSMKRTRSGRRHEYMVAAPDAAVLGAGAGSVVDVKGVAG